ncbi:hypothetical protein LTSEMIS_2555, partial [Salmonella enterica subsp. enterica serovar Mississippi str. A4-633]
MNRTKLVLGAVILGSTLLAGCSSNAKIVWTTRLLNITSVWTTRLLNTVSNSTCVIKMAHFV